MASLMMRRKRAHDCDLDADASDSGGHHQVPEGRGTPPGGSGSRERHGRRGGGGGGSGGADTHSHTWKRSRWSGSGSASRPPPSSSPTGASATPHVHPMLAKYVSILDKDQLVAIVLALADSASAAAGKGDATAARLQAQLRSAIPRPTVGSVARYLESLERKMHDAFPYARAGPARNDYAYNRVRPVLVQLQAALLDFLAYFGSELFFQEQTSDEDPAAAGDAATARLAQLAARFEFLHVATHVAGRLPEWDDPENNHLKMDMMYRLRAAWREAVGAAARWPAAHARVLSRDAVAHWSTLLAGAAAAAPGQLDDAARDFTVLLGWYLGMAPPPPDAGGMRGGGGGGGGAPGGLVGGAPCGLAHEASGAAAAAPVLFSGSNSALLQHLQVPAPAPLPASPPRVEFGMMRH